MKSPFKFLDPYEEKDYESFFGRKTETKELYNLVTKNRLTFVYGPSGTGKTSLVRCGLAHKFGGADWLPIFIRREENINDSLRAAIGKALGDEHFDGLIEDGINELYQKYFRPVYLIFDQFEELFILDKKPAEVEREPFYQTISDVLDAELPCRVLFIMREDYFGYLNEFEKTIPELYHRKIRVEPMSTDNLREVITGSCKFHQIPFGDERTDPDLILENIQKDKEGTHMPHVQVYLHMLHQEAVRQKGEDAICFDQSVIGSVGEIKDVLGRFLTDQKTEIYKKLKAIGLTPPEEIAAYILDIFVTNDGTKIPIRYFTLEDGLTVLTGSQTKRLLNINQELIAACLDELQSARIIRRGRKDYEIVHDMLAAIIVSQRSSEQRQLREIERRIELGYQEHLESKNIGKLYFFNKGQLQRIEPFLTKLALEPEWKKFINDSRTESTKVINSEAERQILEVKRLYEKEKALRFTVENNYKQSYGCAKYTYVFALLMAVIAYTTMIFAEEKAKSEKEALEALAASKLAENIAENKQLKAEEVRDSLLRLEKELKIKFSSAELKAKITKEELIEIICANEDTIQTISKKEDELLKAKNALKTVDNLISDVYFYADRFALARRKVNFPGRFSFDEYYFIDKKGKAVNKLGCWTYADQFKYTGLAKVEIPGGDFVIDTFGNIYSIANDLNDLSIGNNGLDLSGGNLSFLHPIIFNNTQLKFLDISANRLIEIPKEIKNLKNLESINLTQNKLQRLPKEISKLKNLKILDLRNNQFSSSEKEKIKLLLPKCKIRF